MEPEPAPKESPEDQLPVGSAAPRFWAHSRVRSPVGSWLPTPGSWLPDPAGPRCPPRSWLPNRGADPGHDPGVSPKPGSGPGSEPKTGGGEPGPGGWGTSSRAGGSHLPTGERAPRSRSVAPKLPPGLACTPPAGFITSSDLMTLRNSPAIFRTPHVPTGNKSGWASARAQPELPGGP